MNVLAEATVPFRDGETWYAVSEPARPAPGAALPLVVLHGGPGMTHHDVRALADLFDDRQVVLYDQFGTGNSSHRPDWDATLWTPQLFVEQLRGLLAHLGLAEAGGFHLLGHSWGGMLAQEYAVARPAGLASLILSNTGCSTAAIVESMTALRAPISAEEPDEQAQLNLFLVRHVCRLDPLPEDIVRAFELINENPSVFVAMMGPTGEGTGTLRDWTAVPRLAQINVPTLVLAGEYDELQPVAWHPLAEQIPAARAHVFAGASHMPYLESPDEYYGVVAPFLADHDRRLSSQR
jgi:L-proline amide hydrolase